MITNKLFRRAIGVVAAGILCPQLAAQVSIGVTSGLAYSINFDSGSAAGKALANTGTPSFSDNSTLTGWYAKSESGEWSNNTSNNYRATDGSTSADVHSFGTGTDNDRALGTVANDTLGDMAVGLLLQNTTGTALSQLHVMYRGEQWSDRSTTADTLEFSYQVFASQALAVASNLNPGVAAGGSGWVAVTQLDFTTPKNANASPQNNIGNTQFSEKNFAFNVAIPAGSFIMLRWRDNNDGSNDHALGIDNVFIAVPEAGTWAAGALLGAVCLGGAWRARRQG